MPGKDVSMLRGALTEVARPGESNLSGRQLVRLGVAALIVAMVIANVIGAVIMLAVATFVVPLPEVDDISSMRLTNAIAAATYVAVAVPIGIVLGYRGLGRVRRWLAEDRRPDEREQRAMLRAPLHLSIIHIGLWLGAAVLFGVLNLSYSFELARRVAMTVALTGVTVSTIAYLLAERLLRAGMVRALAGGAPQRLQVPGVAARAILTWALGTGVAVLGIVAVAIDAAAGAETTRKELLVAMIGLGGVALIFGLLAVVIAARATADPINSVRSALAEINRGRFDVRVHAYDGAQIGLLQLGFNEMAAGLEERERIRDAFGTYVDRDVAEHILREGISLAGEGVEVTMMFVDIHRFTSFAERLSAADVVATLNRLFERIVPIIHEHEGHVDKYVGDGLLAVFGAPRRHSDHADRALAAALTIAAAVRDEFGEALSVGVGLNSGPVIAGNVGGGGRLEFSVIGDAVNVAARVESATRETGDAVLIAGQTKELLTGTQVMFIERPGLTLKGKTQPVEIYAPVPTEGTAHADA